ncbi:MAG TPA: ribosome maturation factor RimM [Gaiellaceae bacterium]|nr:ribosome maturation factor RimM [Gaiellaceae bacterium]
MSEQLVTVGRVGRPHGLDGSFVVEHPSENEGLYEPGARLYADGEEVTVADRKRSGGRLVVRLDPPVPRGAVLAVPRSVLPPPEPDSYYVFELVGLDVVEEGGRRLGAVEDVRPGVANDVLELDSGLALPMHEACVRSVDLDAGRIVVAPGFADG